MTAPAASVAAVQKALGCERGWDIARPDRECLRLGHNQNPWTDRGCPVAVVAADAAVEAATPGIQAGALREAARGVGGWGIHLRPCRFPDAGCECGVLEMRAVANVHLRRLADRIETNR